MKKLIIYGCSCGHYGKDEIDGTWNKMCGMCGERVYNYTISSPKEIVPYKRSTLDKGDVNGLMKENIRVSHSMGVSCNQFTDEVKKAHPGVEWKKVGNSMCPVIHNRQEKLRVMKQCGMVEYPPNYFGQMEGR